MESGLGEGVDRRRACTDGRSIFQVGHSKPLLKRELLGLYVSVVYAYMHSCIHSTDTC